jgi:hypothetical protein
LSFGLDGGGLPDFAYLLPQHQSVEFVERRADEQLYAGAASAMMLRAELPVQRKRTRWAWVLTDGSEKNGVGGS